MKVILQTIVVLLSFSITNAQDAIEQRSDPAIALRQDNAEINYERSERAAARLAEGLRTEQGRVSPDARHVVSLREQLREEVKRAFQLRMQIQQADLKDAEAALAASRNRLAKRQQLADKIIARRVEQLESGEDTSWLSEANSAKDSFPQTSVSENVPVNLADNEPKTLLLSPEQSKNSKARPNAEGEQRHSEQSFSSYQMFLRNEIGSLQQYRNERLSGLAALESELVSLRRELDDVGNVSPTDRGDTEEHTRLRSAADRLEAQTIALRKLVSTTEAQIAILEKRLLETSEETSDFIAIRGAVKSVDGRRIDLSIGQENGVEKGMRLSVFRDDDFICELEMVEVHSESSTGVIPHQSMESNVKIDDIAILLLDSRLRSIVGIEPGESLFNEDIKRFKFRVPYGIQDVANSGARFMRRYLDDDRNPPIYGMWGDPSTDSLIVIAPADSEAAIREFLIKGEVLATTGFDVGRGEADSLERQKQSLYQERERKLQRLAWYKSQIIDLESKADPDSEELTERKSDAEKVTQELDILERKLQVVNEIVERSNTDTRETGESNFGLQE